MRSDRSPLGWNVQGQVGESGIVAPTPIVSERIEELNPGAPSEPRPAAAVILLRRGAKHASTGLQLLMGKRTSRASFMAGVWVFPGGALDNARSAAEATEGDYRAAALRELEEEASVTL